ncbi:MAG: phage holin family protein, partial [Thermoleophilia bacterium]|nr:phage holin family protein [Thermoleophilia bacterium]
MLVCPLRPAAHPAGPRSQPSVARRTVTKFITRWGITAAAVAVAAWLVPGIYVNEPHRIWTVLLVALVLGLINAFIRPVIRAFSCGLIVLTLGLFTLVINGLMLWLASWITVELTGLEFHVDGFWSAFLGALIISVVSTIVSLFVGDKK